MEGGTAVRAWSSRSRARRLDAVGALVGRWALPGIFALGVLLRLPTLGSQSLWQDEAFTRAAVTVPFKQMLQTVGSTESTPSLYYLLTWFWVHFFGEGEAALRTVSALAGVAVVYVAYLYGRRLAGRPCGLALAAIASVSPLLVWYSQEARAYSLATLLSALGWLAFLRALDGPKPENVLWWAMASGAAAVTHYLTAVFAIVQLVYMLVARPRLFRPLALAAGGLAILAVGLSVGSAVQAADATKTAWITTIPIDSRLTGSVREALVGVARPTWHPMVIAGLLTATAATIAVWRIDARRIFAPALVSLGAVALVVLERKVGDDYVLARNLIFGWLPLAGVIAAGLVALPRRWMAVVASLALCLPLLAVTLGNLRDDRIQRPDWRSVAGVIGPTRQPRLIVTGDGYGSRPLRVYLPAQEVVLGTQYAVRELVTVTLRTGSFHRDCGGGALCGAAPSMPVTPGGWKLMAQRTAGDGRFLVSRYRWPRRTLMDPGNVGRQAISPPSEVSVAYLQLPPG